MKKSFRPHSLRESGRLEFGIPGCPLHRRRHKWPPRQGRCTKGGFTSLPLVPRYRCGCLFRFGESDFKPVRGKKSTQKSPPVSERVVNARGSFGQKLQTGISALVNKKADTQTAHFPSDFQVVINKERMKPVFCSARRIRNGVLATLQSGKITVRRKPRRHWLLLVKNPPGFRFTKLCSRKIFIQRNRGCLYSHR